MSSTSAASEVWLNGHWVPRSEARISAFDAGVQHGVGLFETMAARGGRIIRLRAHLERLRASAAELGLSDRLRIEPLAEAVEATLARSGLGDARLRLTITGGELSLLAAAAPGQAHDPTILIVAQQPTPYPEALFEQGVRIGIVNAAVNPFDPMAGHKTLWYWPRLAALRAAGERGATEALWFSVTTHLACGCVSNVFLVKDGRLLTPIARGEEVAGAIAAPVLPGVTRATVLAQAAELGIASERRDLSSKELVEADEVFLTNSSWGLLPVAMVESKPIGSGRPGPLTRSLLEHYRAAIARGDLTDGGSPAR